MRARLPPFQLWFLEASNYEAAGLDGRQMPGYQATSNKEFALYPIYLQYVIQKIQLLLQLSL